MKTYINGEFIDKEDRIEIFDIDDNKLIDTIPALNKNDINEIFNHAKSAFKSWKFSEIENRINLLTNFANLLKDNAKRIAELMIREIGKNYDDSYTEIIRTYDYVLKTIEVFNKEINNVEIIDEKIHGVKGKEAFLNKVPYGVVLAISPFNYPVNLAVAKFAPALLMGNTVVFKPATQGSLVGCVLAELIHEAGFPAGTFNLITGRGRDIGDIAVQNPNISLITFTGSTKIGNRIASFSGKIPLVLELGGKDAALVLDDADLEKTSTEIANGAFNFSGQRCTAIKRVFVTKSNADELIKKIIEKVTQFSTGYAKENSFITPVIDEWTAKNAISLKEDAVLNGAKIVLDSQRNKNFIGPMILDNVSLKSKLAWEEPFAPILPIIRIETDEKMIKEHNNSEFGLQASIFTENMDRAKKIAMQLEAGTININKSSSRGPDVLPFTGVKNSGIGMQGIKYSLLSMSRLKPIIFNK
ncbi:MAG: aldehyde dehydrogenase family protein [Mycoplasma sp.]|nr:aldehyde dehydrogenase family protein [Mycoplasma sp.]